MRRHQRLAVAVAVGCGSQFIVALLSFSHAHPIDWIEGNGTEQSSVLIAEADLNTILPGGNAGPVTPQSAPPSLQPTYEKWDVLRQYPRFVPVPPPQSQPPAVKPQEAPKPSKENQNA